MLKTTVKVLLVTVLAGASGITAAQSPSPYPVKPITMIVPFPPGGVTDLVARELAKRLSDGLGQPVVVDNRAGAGGNIGTAVLAKAQPDGYTLGVMTVSAMSIGPHIHKSLSFVPSKDFTPITNAVTMPNLLTSHPSVPAKNLKELIAFAKTRPGQMQYATSGGTVIPRHKEQRVLRRRQDARGKLHPRRSRALHVRRRSNRPRN
jgi:tripartite-type tricarboxylate transporter receptor subunit TctC